MAIASIAVIGDYDRTVPAHRAIPKALARAVCALQVELDFEWIETNDLPANIDRKLERFGGIWCAPASPYRSMRGALAAIRFAREKRRAFLGTCGGFQHGLIEYMRNVLGHQTAANAEIDPNAAMPVISPLSCALVEQAGDLRFAAGSRLGEIFGDGIVRETYRCSHGFNAEYRDLIDASALRFTSFDLDDAPRGFELPEHPFFMGVLFQPERSALEDRDHPLIRAFVSAAAER